MFRSRLGMALGPNQTKCHRQPKHVPTDDEQGKANTEKPRIMFTFAAFLSQWILLGPLGLVAALTCQSQDPIFGWRQNRYHLMSPPVDEPMNVPIGRFQQATASPFGDVAWRPAGECSHAFTPWKKGLHDDEPDQYQTVLMFPDPRHAAEQLGNEHGHRRDVEHR